MFRAVAVSVAAVLLAFQVVRTTTMERPGPRVTLGARLWPAHPAIVLDRTMAEIGSYARNGQKPSPATLQRVADVAKSMPLAAEPFLIHGALAQQARDEARAERLFVEARNRDPRSEAARYFLADRYLRSGRTPQALKEIAVFSRLVPTASAQFAPALASFARAPGTTPQLKSFFRSSPEFEPVVLNELAADARNADLIVALATADKTPQPWKERIVTTLVEQRQLNKAYEIWMKVAGVRGAAGGIFNPKFEQVEAPPPFNWQYSTRGGVAEPGGDGRLQVIYYGREDTVIAQQLLVLAPGRYRLAMDVSGQAGDGSGVAWSLACVPGNQPILSLPLKQGQRSVTADFAVPSGCSAQRLQLNGSVGDFPQSLDFTVAGLTLTRIAGQ